MKQCPECNEVFDDQKAFCDMDGAALIDQTEFIRQALNRANPPATTASSWVTGVIGGLIGVIVCVLLYIAFLGPSAHDAQDRDQRPTQTKETVPTRSTQVAAAPLTQVPAAPTASPEASPAEAEASPGEKAPAPATTPVPPAALNNGPIATGGKPVSGGERAIIKLKDGSSVEADAAWEDAQGVWFRRSGLVSFVEKSRVEAITEPAQRRPAPADAKSP